MFEEEHVADDSFIVVLNTVGFKDFEYSVLTLEGFIGSSFRGVCVESARVVVQFVGEVVVGSLERSSPATVRVNSPALCEEGCFRRDVFEEFRLLGREDVVGDVDEYILVEVVGEMGLDVFVEDVEETGGALVSWERSHSVCWCVLSVGAFGTF